MQYWKVAVSDDAKKRQSVHICFRASVGGSWKCPVRGNIPIRPDHCGAFCVKRSVIKAKKGSWLSSEASASAHCKDDTDFGSWKHCAMEKSVRSVASAVFPPKLFGQGCRLKVRYCTSHQDPPSTLKMTDCARCEASAADIFNQACFVFSGPSCHGELNCHHASSRLPECLN